MFISVYRSFSLFTNGSIVVCIMISPIFRSEDLLSFLYINILVEFICISKN